MARGPENRFIDSIHRIIPVDLLYHMKNHNTYNAGIADVWYSGSHGDLWVEYKYVEKLPHTINLLDRKKNYALSALQEQWLRERYEEGRDVIVVLGCKEGGVIFKDRQWETCNTNCIPFHRREIAAWIYNHTKGTNDIPAKARKRIERCV